MRVQWLKWTFAVACSASMGVLVSACNDDVKQVSSECEDSDGCDDGYVCDDSICILEDDENGGAAVCGDGVVHPHEECDTAIAAGEPGACPTSNADCPSSSSGCKLGKVFGEACDARCGLESTSITEFVDGDGCCPADGTAEDDIDCIDTCGNGKIDDGETCDEGNDLNGTPNHCNATCDGITAASCGNEVVEDGEDCDAGGDNSLECNYDCTFATCGDGILNEDAGQECDDGGESAECNADCTLASCGDGIINAAAGETCDDGAENGEPNKCNATCSGQTDPVCGNGVEEAGEDCDDGGNNGEPNSCNADCTGQTDAVCGNNIIEDGEDCDDGSDNGTPNYCNTDCTGQMDAVCGNNVIETGETCDDGAENGDPNKCNATCSGQTDPVCGNGVEESGEACDDGAENGDPNKCNADCTGQTGAVCGNGVREAGETCDDGTENGDPNKCNATCDGTTTPVCGNGEVESGETCDDGAENGDPNRCNATCDGTTTPVCGNGEVESGETCDDGAENGDPNKCNEQCTGDTGSVCGNGAVESGEECDDSGESTACNDNCTLASCGDGIVNAAAGETCDDGAENGDPNKCNATCDGPTSAVCGNSVLEAGEQCDDGGESATCNADCTNAICGDEIVNATAGETCDDGAENGAPNMCNATCDGTTSAVCGNSVVEAGEECDDGGESATCNTDCTNAICGDEIVNAAAGETCDDGAENGDPNKCNATCDGTTSAVCGNSVVEPGEDCDDGGESATCNDDCTVAVCGDGIMNTSAGEECDEGGPTSTCDATCQSIVGPTAFRIMSAEIIDPHMFFKPLFSCSDVTNDGVLGQLPGGVNGMLDEALTEVIGGAYDMSIALLTRPLNQMAQATFDAELRLPNCAADLSQCTDDPTQPIVFTTATNQTSGACFPPSQHLGRNPSYTGLSNPAGPCFKSEPTDVLLSIADIDLELKEASVAATYNADPATNLVDGILVGFLLESVADAAEIDVPVIGKKAVSDFLKGGGGCGGGNDKDTFNGDPGWWFYLNFEAEIVDAWQE